MVSRQVLKLKLSSLESKGCQLLGNRYKLVSVSFEFDLIAATAKALLKCACCIARNTFNSKPKQKFLFLRNAGRTVIQEAGFVAEGT